MIVELRINGVVLFRANLWLLILSYLFHGENVFARDFEWKNAELYVCTPGMVDSEGKTVSEQVQMVPKPNNLSMFQTSFNRETKVSIEKHG